VIRAKYYNEDKLAGAPASFKSAPVNAAATPKRASPAVLCRGLHRLRPVRRGLPGDQPARGRRQGDQHGDKRRCWRPSAPTSPSSRPCRSTTAPASISPMCAACSSWSRCSSSPAPAAAAARRPISSCCPVVRRPAADRQRHRLLVDLWRQPAGHAVDEERRGPRAGLVELAVRGQRRVRPRLPPRRRQASGAGAVAAGRLAPKVGRTWRRRSRRRRSRSPKSARSASASRN
jgi:hypothetical protein